MAQPLTISVPHQLGRQEARRRLENGFDQVQRQLSGGMGAMLKWQREWEGDQLSFEASGLGQKLVGRMQVLDDSLRIEIDLPDFLVALSQRVAGRLRSTAQKLLEKQ